MRAAQALLCLLLCAAPAVAQERPAPPPPEPPPVDAPPPADPPPPQELPSQRPATARRTAFPLGIRGVVTFGQTTFQAQESFEATLNTRSGAIFGGGVQVLLPWNLFAQVAASRFSATGERVFVGPNDEVFPLGIPLEVQVTPLEVTGGWRYRHCPRTRVASSCAPRLIPYVGAGLSSVTYKETSEGAADDENVDERFGGFHLLGGAEFRVMRWMAVGGEVVWSSIAEALGTDGVSATFNEDNLGGTTLRLTISVGRWR